jgi:nitrogenase-associated protein
MTRITFYEKPGCAGNARQRALLEAAGHTLARRDLMAEPWTRERLLQFLAPLPVPAWFNRAAPRIKRGEIDPERIGREAALDALLADPLLIRRPLMERDDGTRLVGFDTGAVDRFVGLGASAPLPPSLEGCASQRARCDASDDASPARS